jgi:hypothetical protein
MQIYRYFLFVKKITCIPVHDSKTRVKKIYRISKGPAFMEAPLLFKGKRYESVWNPARRRADVEMLDGVTYGPVTGCREARAATGTV